ncbi:MAG TPA: hypothetical protein VMC80_02465 [Patescibacteria group bacterium]|nr:hypothetical protein [Patescibacteria group bacterium]
MSETMAEIAELRERMKRELKKGDLVDIALKDNAKVVFGRFPAIILDALERDNNPNKSCTGYFNELHDESVSLIPVRNMEGYAVENAMEYRELEVFYFAIKGFERIPRRQLAI